jgi:hypothetical protein
MNDKAMDSDAVQCTGLDPSNPLAYLTALGALRVVTLRRPTLQPRLSFDRSVGNVPVLHGAGGLDDITAAVMEDAAQLVGTSVLSLSYDSDGTWIINGTGPNRELKPSPETAKRFLEDAATGDPEVATIAASYFSDVVTAGDGRIKPTALHLAAGKMQWLKMVAELRDALTAEHVQEALVGPWVGSADVPSLSWDATAARQYALRATDPSGEKRPTIAGANWLAYRALPFFPVHMVGRGLETTGVSGGWKAGTFAWPLWDRAIGMATIAALSRYDVRGLTVAERRARGIFAVQVSRILRADQGGYGSFSPSKPA